MARYRCLLFDADGTLFDYDSGERRALDEALESVGHPVDDSVRTTYRRVNAALWKALERREVDAVTLRYRRFEHLFTEYGWSQEGARPAAKAYLDALGRSTDLLPGAAALIPDLATHTSLGLVTNGLAEVQRARFGRSELTRHFRAVTISDELGIAKPDRRIIDHTLEALGDPPRDEVMIVGDSLSSDIQAGVNAGIATCWFAPDGAAPPPDPRPDYVIRSLDELRMLVSDQ